MICGILEKIHIFGVKYKIMGMKIKTSTELNDCNSFSECFRSFSKESELAIKKNIPVTFIEGNSVYKTRDGINRIKIIEISPLVKIECKSYRISDV